MTRVSRTGGAGTHVSAAFRCSCDRAVEALERRVLLSTYTVTNVNDSGPGSLRQAILDANANPGGDAIAFNIPGPAPHVIAPQSPLPVITDSVSVAGRTQPGYSATTGAPVIELTGAAAGRAAAGLVLGPDASNSSIQGLDVNRFAGDGVVLQGSNDHLTGCFIGTDPSGMVAEGNGGNGLVVSGSGDGTTGQTRTDRNVISANGLAGVLVTANSGTTGLGDCFIGTNADGTGALGNRHEGVLANGALSISSSISTDTWSQDVISGNGYSGIVLRGGSLTSSITGARIGVNLAGTAAIANGVAPAAPYRDGITLLGGAATIGQHIIFSSTTPNVISGNRGAGIYLGGAGQSDVSGNLIGTDSTGSLPIGNGGDGIVIATDQLILGRNLGPTTTGLVTSYGGNVIAANGGDGILIRSSGVKVQGQYVGINIVGAPMGNRGDGIEIRGGSRDVIGGGQPIAPPPTGIRNVVSANGGAGIAVNGSGTGNSITGNEVGTTPSGATPLGNAGNGVEVFTSGNTVSGNLICGNGGSGVLLGAAAAGDSSGNMILNNVIGFPGPTPGPQVVAADAKADIPSPLGNDGDGITLIASNGNTITGNRVSENGFDGIDIVGGANNTLSQNTLVRNDGNGVTVRESAPGAGDAVGNAITQNTFTANAGLPIDLGGDGPTLNDPGDADTGPNQLQNYPVFVSATTLGTSTTVRFTLDTLPGTYRIEFYGVTVPDLSQAMVTFRAAATVTVGSDPTAVYTATLPAISVGTQVIASATGAAGTSEFMPESQVFPPAPRVVSAAYVYYNSPHPLSFVFTQDVSASLTPSALRLHNVQTGQDFMPTRLIWSPGANVAQFILPASLPIGDYVATLLASQVTDAFGQHLDGDGDGIPGGDYTLRFAYLPGDINQDHTVNFNDLLILAGQFGQALGYTTDINGDGTVNFADLLILAQNYGKSIPAP